MSGQMFFSESISPCHAGGYWWGIEALEILDGGDFGFSESAGGAVAFKWLARRKFRHYKRQFTKEAGLR